MVRRAASAWWLALLLLSQPAWALTQLKASLDKNPLLLGETAVFELQADGEVSTQPDFSALEPFFEVQGPSISQQMHVFNGKASRSTSWRLLLKPRAVGHFTIPAFSLDGVHSTSFAVEVQQAPEQISTQGDELFIKSTLEANSLYVQQVSYLDVRIFFKGELQRGSLNEPKVTGLSIEQQGKDVEGSELVNGERYRTFSRRYRVIAEQSGDFTIPAMMLTGEMLDRNTGRYDYFAKTKSVTATSNSLTLSVAPAPQNFPGEWFIADLVQLTEEWNPASLTLRQGEPVTRTLTLTGLNVVQNQLPDLTLPTPDGVRLYQEQPQTKQAERNGQIVAQKVISMAVVASKAGELTLPEIRLPWWNAKTNRLEYAVLPSVTLQVEALATANEAEQTASEMALIPASAPSSPWAWTYSTSLLFVLWLLSVLAWVLSARFGKTQGVATHTPSHAPANSKPRLEPKKLQLAAHQNDAPRCRAWLLDWAEQYFHERPQSLSQLGVWCQNADFSAELEALNQALYQPKGQATTTWQGKTLWQRWSSLEVKRPTPSKVLAPLYPKG